MKFQLRPDLVSVCPPESGLVLFLGEDVTYIAQNPLAGSLIARIIDGDEPAVEHTELLSEWIQQGLVIPAEPAVQKSESALWTSIGLPPSLAAGQAVELLPIAPAGTDLLQQTLSAVGFRIANGGLVVVCIDDYLNQTVRDLHISFRMEQRPWLPVKLIGHTVWVGPVFAHGPELPCWACLAYRIRQNRWRQCLLWGHDPKSYPPQPSIAVTSTTLAIAANAVAHVLGSWARGSKEFPLASQLYTFDTRLMKLHCHPVTRRPDCPECGMASPLTIPHSLQHLRRFASPITGFVPAVEINGPYGGLYHARADVIQPLPVGNARPLMKPNLAIGKGISRELAEIGCLAEAAERYSIVFQGDEPRRLAPVEADDGLLRVRLDELLQISPRQYAGRERTMHLDDPRQWIPEPYLPDQEIEWTAVTVLQNDLTQPVIRYVPTAYCYLGYPEKANCRPDTNGCAAGRSREDAILRGLLELVERDAAAIWWYNRLPRPAAHRDSFRHPEALLILREFERLGRQVHLLDLTNDIGVPVYAAVTTTPDGREPIFGLGSSMDANQAVFKALAEMSQVWFWIHGRHAADPLWTDWLSHASIESEPYLKPCGEAKMGGCLAESGADAELDFCLQKLRTMGFEPLTLDLTRPDVGLPVARVIVPGLRHFWPRFAPGRLYDVPVRLGWRENPVREQELNPLPCLL